MLVCGDYTLTAFQASPQANLLSRQPFCNASQGTALTVDAFLAPGAICAAEKSRRAAARVAYEEESQALSRRWRDLQRSLSGERGLWMDPDCAEPPHWKLDKFEDPSRRWAP